MKTAPQRERSTTSRGRPATGTALTVAERKALQRKRDRTVRPLEDQTLEALLSAAGQAIQGGDADGLKGVVKEMRRRAQAVAAANSA